MFLFKDKQGNWCAAKTVFVLTWVGLMYRMFVDETFDYSEAAAFLASVGAVYFGRNHTKQASQNAKSQF
jgi:hypothetical protein